MMTLKLIIICIIGAAVAYLFFRMSCAESQRRKQERSAVTQLPRLRHLYTGTITATDEQLLKQLIPLIKSGNMVYVMMDGDPRFLQISQTGRFWYSIYRDQVKIDE